MLSRKSWELRHDTGGQRGRTSSTSLDTPEELELERTSEEHETLDGKSPEYAYDKLEENTRTSDEDEKSEREDKDEKAERSVRGDKRAFTNTSRNWMEADKSCSVCLFFACFLLLCQI